MQNFLLVKHQCISDQTCHINSLRKRALNTCQVTVLINQLFKRSDFFFQNSEDCTMKFELSDTKVANFFRTPQVLCNSYCKLLWSDLKHQELQLYFHYLQSAALLNVFCTIIDISQLPPLFRTLLR